MYKLNSCINNCLQNINTLFEECVKNNYKKIALIYGDKSITYSELNKRSDRLAKFLLNKNIKEKSNIAIVMDNSIEMVIAMIGIMKIGLAFVPISLDYSISRVDYIFNQANIEIIISSNEYKNYILELQKLDEKKIFYLYNYDTERCYSLKKEYNTEYLEAYDDIKINVKVKPSDLMYIIFTSGTTGIPKGVMIEHRSVVNVINSVYKKCSITNNDIMLNISRMCFDIAIIEIFLPLLYGLTVIIANKHQYENPKRLLQLIKNTKPTILQTTPSRFKQLMYFKKLNTYLESINILILGGESINLNCIDYIKNNMKCNLYNGYGPTETTIYASINKVESREAFIGDVVENNSLFVLNNSLEEVSKGEIGEIYISGIGLARGYIGMNELTKEKFLKNPISGESYLYRTGDLGLFINKKNIKFAGRIDRQVKFNGYRIELLEIENVINSYWKIKNSAVINKGDNKGNVYIIAYIVPEKNCDFLEIRNYLHKYLPYYMIPKKFIFVEDIPINHNGKFDKDRLIEEKSILKKNSNLEIYTDLEKDILDIWSDILEVKNIDVNDSFYELGGDSISFIEMESRIFDELDIDITMGSISDIDTVKKIINLIKNGDILVNKE